MVKAPGRGGNDLPGASRINLVAWALALAVGAVLWLALFQLALDLAAAVAG